MLKNDEKNTREREREKKEKKKQQNCFSFLQNDSKRRIPNKSRYLMFAFEIGGTNKNSLFIIWKEVRNARFAQYRKLFIYLFFVF